MNPRGYALSAEIFTAGADAFSDQKNEASKCCDITLHLLMEKTISEKQAERWDHLCTLLS